MTIKQLAKILSDSFNQSPRNEKASMILLFGIRYGTIIKESKHSIKEILELANLPSSYQNGINKGINLAKYVEEKKLTH